MSVIVIAEAGVNHDGDINKALRLVDEAASAGVDYVKFQTFKAERLVSPDAEKADYQKESTGNTEENQFEMLRSLELSNDDHQVLMRHCRTRGINFLSTGFDNQSLDFLYELGLDIFKIPSGEITNYSYLKKIASFKKPIILSTGMADMQEIESALNLLEDEGIARSIITVLHCNTEYPTPYTDVNLHAMQNIGKKFDVEVGYSDHTLGLEVPIAAVALGARIIEKHFTLDKNAPGPDHKASLSPDELRQMVQSIRSVEKAISGDGIKAPSPSEQKNLKVARKSIHLSRDIRKGDMLQDSDLIALRPGDGISPMNWSSVVGKKAKRDLPRYHKLFSTDIY